MFAITSFSEKKRQLCGKKRDPKDVQRLNLDFIPYDNAVQDVVKCEPIEFYKQIINDEILDIIVEESNKYAIQNNPESPLNLTRTELEQFFGILYATSLVKMPSTRMYWSKEFYFVKVAGIMTVNRFERITKCLHFNYTLARPVII